MGLRSASRAGQTQGEAGFGPFPPELRVALCEMVKASYTVVMVNLLGRNAQGAL